MEWKILSPWRFRDGNTNFWLTEGSKPRRFQEDGGPLGLSMGHRFLWLIVERQTEGMVKDKEAKTSGTQDTHSQAEDGVAYLQRREDGIRYLLNTLRAKHYP